MSEQNTIVCYACDAGFILPTIASIKSLRRWPLGGIVRIAFLGVDLSPTQIENTKQLLEPLKVETVFINRSCFPDIDLKKYNKTHVPPTCLSRFYLTDYFGQPGDQILYIDGDTWFNDDPSDLLKEDAPANSLFAAEDQSYFFAFETLGTHGASVRQYFNDIRVDADTGYFNSGVLKAQWTYWKSFSADAIKYFEANLELCRYHDQSALNAVVKHNRIRLSPRWNYQSAFTNWLDPEQAHPAIFHFVGRQKPWHGTITSRSFLPDQYDQDFPYDGTQLGFPLKRASPDEMRIDRLEFASEQRRRDTIFKLRILKRRKRLLELLQTGHLPFHGTKN